MWYAYTMGYISALQRKILLYMTTLVNLMDTVSHSEDIMQSEINQLQKDKCCVISLEKLCKSVKFIELKHGMVIVRAWGRGKWVVTNQWAQNFSCAR